MVKKILFFLEKEQGKLATVVLKLDVLASRSHKAGQTLGTGTQFTSHSRCTLVALFLPFKTTLLQAVIMPSHSIACSCTFPHAVARCRTTAATIASHRMIPHEKLRERRGRNKKAKNISQNLVGICPLAIKMVWTCFFLESTFKKSISCFFAPL